MAVLVTCKMKMIGSKVKVLSFGQHFLHYKSMGKFFIAQGRVTLKWTVWSGNSSKFYDCLHLHASLTTIQWKMKSLSSGQQFPHYKYGSYWLPWKQQFWSNLPQSLMLCFFPPPSDATYKIWSRLADWPQRYSNLKVWMTTTTAGWTADLRWAKHMPNEK